MDADSLKNSLLGLKSKLQTIEKDFETKITNTENSETRNQKIEKEIDNIVKTKNNIIKLNIGGQVFETKYDTLMNIKESIFHNIMKEKLENKGDLNQEIFFDRSYNHFPLILNYLRTKKFTLKGLSRYDIEDILLEAEFYGLSEIVIEASELAKEIEFVSFEWTGQYSTGGTNKLSDLVSNNLNNGFCINSPGWITIELNFEHDIDGCEVGGYNGNTSLFGVTNGKVNHIKFIHL